MRFVATDSRVGHSEFGAVNGSDHVADYFSIVIASGDVARFRLSWDGWFRSGGQEVSMTNSYSVRCCIQDVNHTVSVPVFRDGLRDITVSPGDTDLQSDWIYPSSFGLSTFAKGSVFWFKGDRTYASGGAACIENGFEAQGAGSYPGYPGARAIHYVSSSTGLSPLDALGEYGVDHGSQVYLFPEGYRPHVIGEFVSGDPMTLMGIIDSINASGNGDNEYVGSGAGSTDYDGNPNRGGMGRVAAHNFPGGPIAYFNASKNSATAEFTAKTRHYFSYARVLLDESGANDLGRGVAAFQATLSSLWADAKTAGMKIVRPAVFPRTGSSNNFHDAVGQDYQTSQFSPGNDMATMNAWFQAQRAAGNIDFYLPTTSVRDSSGFKWNSDGTDQKFTADGTHPSQYATGLIAVDIVNVLRGIDAIATSAKRLSPGMAVLSNGASVPLF